MLCLALPVGLKVQKLDFQSGFSMSKIIQSFLIFFSLRNKILGAHFLLKCFLVTSILKPLQMVKSCPIFDEVAKLGKSTKDTYDRGG